MMTRIAHRIVVLSGLGFVLLATGCSATRAVTSKRESLTPRIDAITAARKTAAAFDGKSVSAPAVPPVVSGKAPYAPSNTLVIEDKEIDAFATEVSPDKTGSTFYEPSFGSGDDCARDVAHVLKFDHFRDDGPHAGADGCVTWLLALKYVIVVHVDKRSSSGADVDTYASGSAVLVDLSTAKALGKLTFDDSSKGRAEDRIVARTGQRTTVVLDPATGSATLIKRGLADGLTKVFPAAKVDDYRPAE